MSYMPLGDRIVKREEGPLRIAQFLPPGSSSWGEIMVSAINNKGMGGRETAVVKLGEQFAIQGHHVTCFTPVEKNTYQEFDSGGILEFIDARTGRVMLENNFYDVVISWEYPDIFEWDRLIENSRLRIVGMQCAHLIYNIAPYHENIDAYVCLSNWAKDFLPHSLVTDVDADDIYVIPNGVDLSRYPIEAANSHPEDRAERNFFIYSSSPDRGLLHVLNMWPKIRNVLPDSILHVGYGIENWTSHTKWSHNLQGDDAVQILKLINQKGVINRGLMGQQELAETQLLCSALLYPCDTHQPTETGCITVTEALAAMLPAVITDCDCLGSEYKEVTAMIDLTSPFDEDTYIDVLCDTLKNKETYRRMQIEGREFAEKRTWERTSQSWLSLMDTLLNEQLARSVTS